MIKLKSFFIIIIAGIGGFFLFIIPILIIYISKFFSLNEVTAGDILAYYGTVLTFISTSLLGYAAIKLSIDSNKRDLLEGKKLNAYIEKETSIIITAPQNKCSYRVSFNMFVVNNIIPDKIDVNVLMLGYGLKRKDLMSIASFVSSNITVTDANQLNIDISVNTHKPIHDIIDYKRIEKYKKEELAWSDLGSSIIMPVAISCNFIVGDVITPALIFIQAMLDEEYIAKSYSPDYQELGLRFTIKTASCISKSAILKSEYDRQHPVIKPKQQAHHKKPGKREKKAKNDQNRSD